MQEKINEYLTKYKNIVFVNTNDFIDENGHIKEEATKELSLTEMLKLSFFKSDKKNADLSFFYTMGTINFLFCVGSSNSFVSIINGLGLLVNGGIILGQKGFLNNFTKLHKPKTKFDILNSFKNRQKMMLKYELRIEEINFLEEFFVKNMEDPLYGIKNFKKECENYLIELQRKQNEKDLIEDLIKKKKSISLEKEFKDKYQISDN